jgi:Domain of unknown function (DUF4381)
VTAMDPTQLPLRDWHAPPPVGWWPIAPGWWIVLVSSLLFLALAIWLWRRLMRPTVKRIAKKELKRLRSDPNLSDSDRIRQLSILLRRICVSLYPRAETARLTGMDWLRFLERTLDEPLFSEGPGSVLVDAPYRRDVTIDHGPLFSLCERWIESLPEAPFDPKPRKAG